MSAHRWMALAAAVLALGAFATDAALGGESGGEVSPSYISAPELAARIVDRDPRLRVFDLRSRAEFDRFHVPGARHATLRDLARGEVPGEATAVVYAQQTDRAIGGWTQLRDRHVREVFVLRGGLYEWIVRIHEPRLAIDATSDERTEFERAVRFSRFFGGAAHEDVPRADLPAGYWTGGGDNPRSMEATLLAVAAIRRRGC